MPLPPKDKPYAFKDRVELAIDDFAKLEKPTVKDLNKLGIIGQVQERVDTYRAAAMNMTLDELENEKHNPDKLAQFMEGLGDPRPHPLCDAHAIISGGHASAVKLRGVLAWFQRRIDDPINGCWLPRNTDAKKHMPHWLKDAVPHSRIHRKHYYEWLESFINLIDIKNDAMLVQALKMTERKLQTSTFPPRVMLPAGK